jgi:hypothetical protein
MSNVLLRDPDRLFGLLRHSLYRLISAWKTLTQGASRQPNWPLAADCRPLTLATLAGIAFDASVFVDQRRRIFENKIRHHTMPQTHPFSCPAEADFVGHFKFLAPYFSLVVNRFSLQAAIPQMYSTARRSQDVYLWPLLQQRCRGFFTDHLLELGY